MSQADERSDHVRLAAVADGHARIHQAGRDLHVHYGAGVRRAEPAPSVCPYPGLAAFGQDDARWFFGRDRLTAELLEHLDERRHTGGVQVVIAPSGAGKSSLLRAGLTASLARGALPGSRRWRRLVITPTATPLAALADGVATLVGDPALTGELVADPYRCVPALSANQDGAVLVVDQFEELFTLCGDDRQRRTFVDVVTRLAEDRTCLVVIGVRADFYADCVNHPRLRAALRDRPVVVGPMSEAELREVIRHPASDVGLDVEPGLVEVLLRDLGADADGYPAGRLPLLAHALRVAWQQRHGTTLTVDGYRTTGGISGAVARTADRVCDELGDAAGDTVRSLFLRLVRIGDGTDDTRRRVSLAELTAASDDPARTATVVDAFTSARLLTQDHDIVEISHEVLLRGWPRLRGWIDGDRAGRLLRQRVEESALAWDRGGRDSALLYRGSLLDDARSLTIDSPVVRAFVGAAVRQRRRATGLRTGTVVALAVLTVVASVAALVAIQQRREARDQRDLAVANRVGAEAAGLRGSDASLAAQLDLVRHRLRPTDETATQLVQDANSPLYSILPGGDTSAGTVAFDTDGGVMATVGPEQNLRLWNTTDPANPVFLGETPGGAAEPVDAVAFGPDGDTVVSTGAGTGPGARLRLWDVSDPTRPVPAGAPFDEYLAGHLSVRLRQDGRVAATVDHHTILLWYVADRNTTAPAGRIDVPEETVHDATFSPDGRLVAVARNESIRLWDVSNPSRPVPAGPPLAGHDGFTGTVAFGPDGRIMASAGLDGAIRLWDVSDPARPAPLGDPFDAHEGSVNSVVFSQDGNTLASASFDGTVRLWDVADPSAPLPRGQPLLGHTKEVRSVVFHPDGTALVSVGEDGTVRLWTLPPVATGATDTVWVLAFSPDGRTMVAATGSYAGSADQPVVSVWDVSDPGRPKPLGRLADDHVVPDGYARVVEAMAFSADGDILATVDVGGVRLWDLTNPARPTRLGHVALGDEHPDEFIMPGMAFAPDGRTVAAVDLDGVVSLVDVSDPATPVRVGRLPGGDVVRSVAFDPVRHHLAAAGDELVRRWDVSDPAAPVPVGEPLRGQDGWGGVVFSPDGNTLVTHDGGDVVLFRDVSDVDSPGPVRELAAHTDSVNTVAFSPDGRTLASASADNTVQLWDVAGATRRGRSLTDHTDVVRAVAFRPTGDVMATAGSDRTIRLWRTNVVTATEVICESTRDTLTETGWRRYVGEDLPFDPPCG